MNQPEIYKKRFAVFIGSVIALAFVVIAINYNGLITQKLFTKKILFDTLAKAPITASSVYILDTATGNVILEKNATVERPLASITKVMTAIVALDLWPEAEILPANLPNVVNDGNNVASVMVKENWRLQNLIQLMLTKSSNEAAESIVQYASTKNINFVELMNQKAKQLQLWKTSFRNASGLDLTTGLAGAYSSAEDVSYLFQFALKTYPQIFEYSRSRGYNAQSEAGTSYFVENTNTVATFLPELIAAKTGFTDLAGGNLVFALKMHDGRTVIVSLLGSTKDGRFNDAERITQALRADYAKSIQKK